MNYWVFVFGAMIMWGLWGFLPKLASNRLSYTDATVWEWIGMSVVALPCLWIARGRPDFGNGAGWFALATGVCGLLGALLYYRAMASSGTHTASVIVVSALYPVISVILTVAILGHKINMGQAAGIALCLAGSMVLARYSR